MDCKDKSRVILWPAVANPFGQRKKSWKKEAVNYTCNSPVCEEECMFCIRRSQEPINKTNKKKHKTSGGKREVCICCLEFIPRAHNQESPGEAYGPGRKYQRRRNYLFFFFWGVESEIWDDKLCKTKLFTWMTCADLCFYSARIIVEIMASSSSVLSTLQVISTCRLRNGSHKCYTDISASFPHSLSLCLCTS